MKEHTNVICSNDHKANRNGDVSSIRISPHFSVITNHLLKSVLFLPQNNIYGLVK